MASGRPITSDNERGSLTKAELDKSWAGFQPLTLMVTCSDGRIINARHGNKRTASILLEFLSDDGEKYVMYFNAVSNKKGYAVNHNSKFASLYRLVVGANPVNRYSKVRQLIKHFIGYEFNVQESELKYDNGTAYRKIINCSPVHPVSSIEWGNSGRLKPKTKKEPRLKPVPKLEANWKNNGNELEKDWKNNGNELEMQNSRSQHKHLVRSDNLPRNNVTKYQRNKVQSNNVVNDNPIEDKPIVTYHKRNKGEGIEDYYDRVMDETFFN